MTRTPPTMMQQAMLELIVEDQNKLDRAREELFASIESARANGCTWQQIADLYGVTRSAAEQRFNNNSHSAQAPRK